MARVILEHTNGKHVGELIELDRNDLLIGRMSTCDIVTEPKFTSVSQRHAILRRTADGWIIIDVGTHGKGSTYGTCINDIRLELNKQAVLRTGDEIRLGTKLGKYFRFHGEGTVPVSQSLRLSDRLSIDIGRRQVLLDMRAVSLSLTPQEFEFLLILWQKSGSICLFKEICSHIWPEEKTISLSTVDADLRVRINTLVHGLRRKLKLALDGIDVLESCRGVGYRLRL